MKQLVLISHGKFAEELKKSTEMIMGPQDCIHTVCFLPEEGQAEFREKFENAVKDLDDYVILADLLGGTPANVISKMILEGQDIQCYAGMNMPMVIGFLNGVLLDQEVDLVGYGKDNIHHINEIILQDSDDEDE